MRINLPNQVTLARLGLAVVFVALLSWFDAAQIASQRWLLHVCFWLFLLAALMDVLDGLLARMMRSITSFGRIVDPVVDKVMICGAFLLFASHPFWDGQQNITGVHPWMVVLIVARELLVSAVRSHSERAGQEFGALWFGKVKMFVQSVTVCVILGQLAWNLPGVIPVRNMFIWATVIITTASALQYLHRARAFLLTSAALGGTPTTTPSSTEFTTPKPAPPAPVSTGEPV